MADSSTPPRSGGKRRWPLVAGVLVLAVALLLGVFVWSNRGAREERRQAEAAAEAAAKAAETAAAAELARLKNVGLGYLENEEAGRAIAPFETIAQRRPDLALGPRNLAVARLIELAGGTGPDDVRAGVADAEQVARAEEVIDALRQVEPDSPVTAVLAARIAAAAGKSDAARAALDEAIRLGPELAWVRFERYRLDRLARDEALREQAVAALAQAYRLEPRNLWVTLEWLAALAERRDAAITEVIESAREPLTPLAEGIAQRARVDVLELLEAARVAAEQGDWPTVLRNVRVLGNVVRPEDAAQADQLRVNLNTLEFVAVDFPPEFYTSMRLRRRPTTEPIPVQFVPGLFGVETIPAEGVTDVAVADFDLDGRQDVAIVRRREVVITSYANGDRREILRFETPEGYDRILVADLDADADAGLLEAPADGRPCHDADPDVVLYGPGGVLVLENRREGEQRSLVPIEQPEELAALQNVLAAALVDFDLDGDLDLVVSADGGVTLWANVGGLQFEERTARVELPPADVRPTVILPVDLDRDVDLDLILAGGNGPAGYLENLRHGNLRWQPFEATGAAQAVELVDTDGNASWDVLLAGVEGVTRLIGQTPQPGRWIVRGSEQVADGRYDRFWQFDYDNDGLPDLLARREDGTAVLLRNTGEQFEATGLLDGLAGRLIAADYGDLDHDGDLDLVLATENAVLLVENQGGNANRWIAVGLLAQQVRGGEPSRSGRVNHNGIGSLLELKSGEIYQPAVVRKAITHLGLGSVDQPDVLRVVWTNGIPANVLRPTPLQFLCEQQTLKGSCPYLYTFDGEQFVFSTDLLWSAPIGLQFAEGVAAPCRPWEYLKLDTPLRPNAQGQYILKITEELWEAAYLDHVKLIVVDHPAGIEIFTNEKVGPPEIAEHRLYTVAMPRPPVVAKDGKGRDVTALLTERDDLYVKAFDEKFAQGLCEPHVIELDFGDVPEAGRVTLFLTGWIYPTDTSINVALGQRADAPQPQPPALSVPNEAGEWVEVIPYTGFPGGKTKTIAIDLTGRFLCNDRRVRIDTSAEIYWDAAFLCVNEPAVATITRECPLVSAELRFRGVSAKVPHPQHGPERYEYSRTIPDPVWPPMRGRFTRYGTVTELLNAADDLLVVMGAGDELMVRFTAPTEPPPGWMRSFILHTVGYDKDADLNTIYGQSSEPLPFLEMNGYPDPALEAPETPTRRRYLEEYQTRTQPSRRFWTAVRDFESHEAQSTKPKRAAMEIPEIP